MRRALPYLAAAALVAVVAVGLSQAGGSDGTTDQAGAPSLAEARERLAGAPAPLARLHAQANELLPGSPRSFERRLRTLRGYPVVVNKWASWCPPCKAEFPFFAGAATRLGREVAFLGLNSADGRPPARRFLQRQPVPFPHVVDPNSRIAQDLGIASGFPMTAFYDRRGRQTYVHQGGYASEAQLLEDIERYAR